MRNRLRRIFEGLDPKPDALVLANATDPHIDQSFFYVFDAPSGLFEGSVAVGYPDGSMHVLSSLLEEESARQAARSDPDAKVSVFHGKDEWERLVRELVPSGSTVALNYRELTHTDFLNLDGLLPETRWIDASEAIRRARRVKDPSEVERLERAGAIASEVAREIPQYLKRGVTELGLAAEIEYQMSRRGAAGRSFATITAFGPKGAEPHYAPQDRPLEPGSSLVCDFGALYRRYASDITRSFRFMPRDDELKRVHDTVMEAQAAALAVVKAGAPAREVHLAAERVVDASPWKGRFIHGVGHSIGLAVHDGFGMNARTDDVLEDGMTITVEPGIYLPGRGGVRIEDDILVTGSGYRFLTTAPREYIEVGG